jgi:hypothetical protein
MKNIYLVREFGQRQAVKFTNKKVAISAAKKLSQEKRISTEVLIGDMSYLKLYWFGSKKAIYQYSGTGHYIHVTLESLKYKNKYWY